MRIGNDATGYYTIEMPISFTVNKKPVGAGLVILADSILTFGCLSLLSFNTKVRTSVASLKRS